MIAYWPLSPVQNARGESVTLIASSPFAIIIRQLDGPISKRLCYHYTGPTRVVIIIIIIIIVVVVIFIIVR